MAKKAKILSADEKKEVKDGYKHGITVERLSIMYKVTQETIKSAVSGITPKKG